MEPDSNIDPLLTEVRTLSGHGHSMDSIERKLRTDGVSDHEIQRLISALRQHRRQKYRVLGMVLLSIGAVLTVSGFVLTYILTSAGIDHAFALYGLTSAGTLFMFAAAVLLLGW